MDSNEDVEEDKSSRKRKKPKKAYKLRDVIKHHYKSRIEDEIPYKSTDREYLGSYQRAVTTVMTNMSEEDLEEAEKLLETWNKEGGPSDVQLKWVSQSSTPSWFQLTCRFRKARKKLPQLIRNKLEDWKFESGAVILCLVAYSDGKEVNAIQ